MATFLQNETTLESGVREEEEPISYKISVVQVLHLTGLSTVLMIDTAGRESEH